MSTQPLRERAEQQLAAAAPKLAGRSPEETLHELLVYQIELEMQNETLRQTQIALEKSLDRYVDLYEFAPVGYLTLNQTGLIIEVNLTAASMMGVERAQILNRRFVTFIAATDVERWRRQFHNALRHEHKQQLTLTLINRQGVHCRAHLDCLPIAGGTGEPALRVTLTDVSDHYRAEQLVSESHALNIAILNAVPASIAVLDPAGTVIAVNENWRHFARNNRPPAGSPAPNAEVGCNYLAACAACAADQAHDGCAAYAGIKAVMDGRQPAFDLDYALDTPGLRRWFNMSVTPLGLPSGGVVIAHHEISERKRAASALLEKEAQYRAVIESAADGVWVADATGRLIAVNEAYARRSGYSREELLTMNIADLEAEESPEEVQAHMEKVQRQGSDLFETRHRARNGEQWPVEVNVSFSGVAGGLRYAFFRDISERRRNEARLQALRTEMEQVMRHHVARQTVAALAHELNQPLNALASYSDAALHLLRTGNPQPERLQHALESASQQAQRAGQVVRELLDFVSHGRIAAATLNLNELVRAAIDRLSMNTFGPVRPRLDLDPALAPVRADPLQVEKVLTNLVQNGIEAMRGADQPSRAISVVVRTHADGRMAQVTVRDNGPGIDDELMHRIFDPFFTTKQHGLGMGLAISRAIIEAHGGQLWVESRPGAGAAFHFTLPCAP